jgi:hypothetical protein
MKQNLSSNQLANRQSKTDLVGQNLINTPGKRKGDAFMYGEPVQMENMRRLKNEETVSPPPLPNNFSASCNQRRGSAKTQRRLHLSSMLRLTLNKTMITTAS